MCELESVLSAMAKCVLVYVNEVAYHQLWPNNSSMCEQGDKWKPLGNPSNFLSN